MLGVGGSSKEISSMSVIEWPGWLKCDGTAAFALAWSGLLW